MEERTNIRERLRKYNLSYIWLISQLQLRAVVTDKTEMSSVIAGVRNGPKAEKIIQTAIAVLDSYEQGSVLVVTDYERRNTHVPVGDEQPR